MANELKFSATIDDSQLQKKVTEIESAIGKLKDANITINLKGGGGGDASAEIAKINEQIKQQEASLKSLQNAWDKISDAQKKVQQANASNVSIDTSAYQQALGVVENYYKRQSELEKEFVGRKSRNKIDVGDVAFGNKMFDALEDAIPKGKKAVAETESAIRQLLASMIDVSNHRLFNGETISTIEEARREIEQYKKVVDYLKNVSIPNTQKSVEDGLQDASTAQKMIDKANQQIEVYERLIPICNSLIEAQSKLYSTFDPNTLNQSKVLIEQANASQQAKEKEAQATKALSDAQAKYDTEVSKNNQTLEQAKEKLQDLKAQKAELEKNGTASTLKPQEIQVTLNRENFDKQLQKLTEDITKYQQDHKIEIQGAMVGAGSNVAITIKLDDQKNVEEQLQAVKKFAEEWSQKTPVQIKTELVMPQNTTEINSVIQQSLGGVKEIFNGIAKDANGTIPELQKSLGTGELTEQWKQAKDALDKYTQSHEKLISQTEKDNLAVNTGKNTDIYAQLQSVLKLFNEAKSGADSIEPGKLSTALQTVRDALNGLNLEGVSNSMKTAVNNIHAVLNDMERIGVTGVSPLESAVLKAESAIANSVVGIRQAVQEMIAALQNDNLSAFSARAEKAATAIETLSTQLNGFNNVAMNEGGMRDLLTGLGMLINNLQKISGENVGSGAAAAIRAYESQYDALLKKMEEVDLMRQQLLVRRDMNVGNSQQFEAINLQIKALDEYRQKLVDLANVPQAEWNASAVKTALGSEFTELKAGTAQTNMYAESVRTATIECQRLNDMLLAMDNVRKEMDKRHMNTDAITAQMSALAQAYKIFENIRDNGLAGGREMAGSAEYINTMKQAQKVFGESSQSVEKLDKDFDHFKTNINAAQKEIDALKRKFEEADKITTLNKTLNAPVDLTSFEAAMKKLEAIRDKYKDIVDQKDFTDVQKYKSEAANVDALARANIALAEAKVAVNKQYREENKKTGVDPAIKNVEDAIRAYKSLSSEITKLTKTSQEGEKFKFDTTDVDNAIAKLLVLRERIGAIMNGTSNEKTASITGSKEYIDATNQGLLANNSLAAKNAEEKAKAAASTSHLTDEERRLADAINQANNAGRTQSQVLSDLQGLAAQYFSVYAAQQFLQSMVEITGELELQKKSLEVIIGSASTAADMYGQIRDMSQQSPYTFQDLMKAERQLAAFNVPTSKLYDTMKSLTDIGAGLNVDVSRLILAYGHTKAYGYLSGIQNRQFETAGIDLMGELAKMYNKRADEAAKNGITLDKTTRMDLYKRMRSRSIPFEDVEEVIMNMDKEGGKFYNMQERQFETLGGKLRNLKNNWNIMMSEMGESTHGALTGGVNAINTATENWSKLSQIITDVAVGLGAAKAAQLAFNAATFNLGNGAKAYKAAMNQATLNARDNWAIGNGNAYGATQSGELGRTYGKLIAQSNQLTNSQKVQAILHKNVNATAVQQLVTEKVITQEYANRINNMGTIRRGLERMRISARMFGAEMKAALFNPQMAIFAMVTAAFSLWNYLRSIKETINSVTDNTKNNASQDANTLGNYRSENADIFGMTEADIRSEVNKRMKAYDDAYDAWYSKYKKKIEKGEEVPAAPKQSDFADRETTDALVREEDRARRLSAIRAKGASAVLEEVQKQLENMDPLYKGDLFDVDKFKDEAEKADAIIQKLKDIEDARNFVAQHAGDFAAANDRTHDIFSDSFATDVKDYQGYVRAESNALSQVSFEEMDRFIKANKEYFARIAENYRLDINKDRAKVFQYGAEDAIKNQATNANANIITQGLQADIPDLWKSITNKNKAEQELKPEFRTMGNTAAKDFIEGFKEGTINQNNFGTVVADMTKQLLENDAFKVSDPETQSHVITQMMLDLPTRVGVQLAHYPGGEKGNQKTVEEAWAATTQYVEGVAGPKLVEAFKGIATDTNDATVPEAQAAVKSVCESMEREFSGFSLWLHHEVTNWADIIKAAFDQARPNKDEQWKIDATSFFGKTALAGVIQDCKTAIEWLDKARKQVKETKEMINGQKAHFEIELGIGATKSAKAFLDAYKAKYGMSLTGDFNYVQTKQTATEFATAQQVYQGLLEIENLAPYKAKTGYDLDPQKNKKTNKKTGSQTDQEAKKFRELLKIIKDAYQWYEKWEKKIGAEGALKKVHERYDEVLKEYGDVLKKYKIDLSFDNIPQYENMVKAITDKAGELYKTKAHHNSQMLEVVRQGTDMQEDVQWDRFTEASDRYLSSVQRKLEDLTRQWEMFDKVRETTGNKMFAMQVAGFNPESFGKATNVADLQATMVDKFLEAFDKAGSINLDNIIKMSEDDIEKLAQKTLGYDETLTGDALKEQQENVASLTELLKKLRDAQRKLEEERATAMANALASGELYLEKLQKINDEYQRQYELVHAMPASPERDRAEKNLAVKRDADLMKNSYEYQRAMSDTFGQTEKEFKKFADTIQKSLVAQLEAGLISAEDYANEIEKINTQLSNIQQTHSNTTAFMQGGLSGLFQNIQAMGKNQTQQGASMVQQGISLIQQGDKTQNAQLWGKGMLMKAQGNGMIQGGQAMSAKGANGASTVAILDAIINGINDNVQSLMKALNNLADELDYFGDDLGDTVRDSDFYGFMSGFSKSSQGAADGWNSLKNGDIAGAANGVIQSVTGWYTGIAQWHDDRLSRAIKNLQKEVKNIEDVLNQIDKRRERTLGYDTNSAYYDENISWYTEKAAEKDAEWQAKYGKQTGVGTYAAAGAAAGAGVASVIPVIGTAFGAAVGSVIGSVIGIFKKNNHKDENQSKAYQAMADYYEELNNMGNNGYEQEYNLLLKERENLMTQLNDEMSKKKKDDSVIQDLKEQIAELDDQINNYKEDMMKELLGIDLKSYASSITDALCTAWENGEDAAKAYGDTVRELLQDVVKNALQLAVVEPALKQMQEDLEGAYDLSDPEGSANKMAEIIASYLGPAGAVTKALSTVNTTLDETEAKLNEVGVTLYNVEDIAESVFSINIDDWASQLSDSLTSAFYNGEIAAENYADTVKSVMQQVVTSMLTSQFIQPMMDQLEQQLYGWTDTDGTVHKGAFDASNPSGSIADVSKLLSDYFGEGGNGNATITAANEFANAIEQVLAENGLSLKNTTSSSTTNAISSAATEETMGVVSGYLAAIRQDVSVKRVYVTQLVQDYMPDLKDKWTSSNTSLSSIDRNVANIYDAISKGDGALYQKIERLSDDIHNAYMGNGSIKMR